MDPIRNPFAPSAGRRPPELAGREEILDTAQTAVQRTVGVMAELDKRYHVAPNSSVLDNSMLGAVMPPTLERQMFNEIGLLLVERYAQGIWNYNFCDEVANNVFNLMLNRIAPDVANGPINLPDPMYTIYLAFDAGECRRSGDPDELDPIAAYTDPWIAKIRAENRT